MLFRSQLQSYRSAFALFFVVIIASCNTKQQADTIIHNGVIYTVDNTFSVADAMVIKDGKIVETGTGKLLLEKYKADEIIDLDGKAVLPGLIDAHCHFTGFATDMWKCSLVGTSSFEEIISILVPYSKVTRTEWIYGRGWDQNDWANKSYPDKTILDSLFPDRPVFLKRIDGHAAIVNQKALDIAGISDTSKISGGSFEKKDGRLTGLLIDNAMDMVDSKIPLLSDSLARKYYLDAQQLCFAVGLTGVHDCGVSEHTIKMVDEEQQKGNLKMKIFALLADSIQYYDAWIKKGPYKTGRLNVGGFKLYSDGALGSRGACMLQPYSDKSGWLGFLLSDTAYFSNIASKLGASQFQMCTHAIGDSGNRQILNTYARVLKGKNDRRWRIEHAQVVNENDFYLFEANNIIPSVQPTHATSDMYWAEERVGARISNAYAYKKLLSTNSWMPLGTDFPVEDISPFKTFFAAVVRRDAKGFPAAGFQMENALSRQEAIRGMTIWAAKAAFEENEKGSLEAGKWADFIIIDRDILKVPEQELLATSVISTYINGQTVFKKASLQ